ncbi:LuxR C-terminal-related transcriptional regulator [Shigella flexneri]
MDKQGKTSAEIAMILSISENTVNFPSEKHAEKINAPNKRRWPVRGHYWLNLISFLFCVPDPKNRLKRHALSDFMF